MKKTLSIIFFTCLLAACQTFPSDPYAGTLCKVAVRAAYPEPYQAREGVVVSIEDINLGGQWTSVTDGSGVANFSLPSGLFRISISDRDGDNIFNGTSDKIRITSDATISLPLLYSKAGSIVIKEIYCGGCRKDPEEGTYQADKYIILHNNDVETRYLDSLCFGSLHPFNSNGTNPWVSRDEQTGETDYGSFLPVAQCIWQFPGSGSDFPLEPGEDAVICINGAIDHSEMYPLSVNLNKPDYFVCYNTTYFPNTSYHPAPGNLIDPKRILDVVIKTGQANAYTYSISSPATVIFRAKGTTIQDFVLSEGAVVQTPGDSRNPVVAVPFDWVLDAVEVFNGSSASNTKRLAPSLDAGYVPLSGTFLGHTLMRMVDEQLSAANGFEVLADTNNSTADFYETEKQSLHE